MLFLSILYQCWCGDYSIILALPWNSIVHVCLKIQAIFRCHILFIVFFLKIHIAIAWINWTAFQIKLKPNLMSARIRFYKMISLYKTWSVQMTSKQRLVRLVDQIRNALFFTSIVLFRVSLSILTKFPISALFMLTVWLAK